MSRPGPVPPVPPGPPSPPYPAPPGPLPPPYPAPPGPLPPPYAGPHSSPYGEGPAAPPPGWPGAHSGHPVAPHLGTPPTGEFAWLLGVLVFTLLPAVSSVVAGVVMAAVGRRQRQWGPLAEENGRRSANWGITYALATVLLFGAHFVVLFTLDDRVPPGFFPMGIFLTVWAAMTVLHVVMSIAGFVIARRGRIVRFTGIPFFRARRR